MTQPSPPPNTPEGGDADSADLYLVTPDEAGQRLDQFCQTQLGDVSRARVQDWVAHAQVLLNDKPSKAAQRLKTGDRVLVTPPPPEPSTVLPQAIPLAIVYEDAHLLVIDKPVGMVVHPAPGSPDGTLVNALLHHCQGQLSGVGGVARPGIVHRLDKDTSGLIVVAKHDKAHAGLSAQIAAHTAARRYWAVVGGHMPEDSGRIALPIARHPTQRQKMAVVTGGREAATNYEVLESFRGYDWVQCALETGRTHQIRVHLAHLGHPIVGDPLYGGDKTLPIKLVGQALHARELHFSHPVTGEAMAFTTEPPPYFNKLLTHLRSR